MTAFLRDAFTAAFPFLLLAAAVSLYCGLMMAGRWFIKRGLRRRAERLHGWSTDPRSITDREIESLR